MKILLGSSLYAPNAIGGAEKVVQALAMKLVALGHKVAVMTTQPHGTRAHRIVNGVSVHYVPVRNIYRPFGHSKPGPIQKSLWRVFDSYNWRMRSPIATILDEEKPDVVNTHNLLGFSVSLWSVAFEKRIPLIHTMHDQYLLCHRGTMFRNGRNCTSRCFDCRVLGAPRKRASRMVESAIGVSQFISQRHSKQGYFPSAMHSVIYNTGLDLEPPTAVPRSAPSRLRFGFLGQIIPTKGVQLLIDAFRRMPYLDADLIIAGKGQADYETKLRADSAADKRIKWLGYVAPDAFFGAIDVLAVPSVWNDTAPLVILEAFRQGVPVLGAHLGGIPELIAPGTGWVFTPHDEAALDRAVRECSASEKIYHFMSAKCLEYASRIHAYPWEELYVSAYETALKRSQCRDAAL